MNINLFDIGKGKKPKKKHSKKVSFMIQPSPDKMGVVNDGSRTAKNKGLRVKKN